MPESAAESALWMTGEDAHTPPSTPLRTPQTWKVTSGQVRAPQAKRKFELGLPFTLVSGLFSGPRLRRAVVS